MRRVPPLLEDLSTEQRRDGAFDWGNTKNLSDPEKMVGWFTVESWAEHLRQHHRASRADADVQGAVRAFHAGPNAPMVRHFLTVRPGRD
ncbi:MFS transporter [Roseomonas sp. GCM10028921]